MIRSILLLILISLFVNSNITAQQDITPTKGKEFWFGFMDNLDDNSAGSENNKLHVYVSSNKNTSGTITMPQSLYTQSFTVTANITTEIEIDKTTGEADFSEQIENKGFLLETEDTVSVFIVNFENGSADGTRVLPIHSLGSDYKVLAYPSVFQGLTSEFLIVATADNTEVEIIPSATTLLGKSAGTSFYATLDRGEVYQVKSFGDLSGSIIKATDQSGSCRPFALFAGAECANIPSSPFCTFCDHLVDQHVPVTTWGKEYHMIPISGTNRYSYRVMANRDNTNITINGAAPFILNAGEFLEANGVNAPQVFTSDKEIFVIQLLEGSTCAGAGDPSLIALNATSQRINDITFTTTQTLFGFRHFINILTPTSSTAELLLDNTPINPVLFSTFPSDPAFSYASVEITQGSHSLKSSQGFIAYIYGIRSGGVLGEGSYAYSAGSFSPVTRLGDTIYCTSDTVTLINILNFQNPYWTTASAPDDTLAMGDVFKVVPTGGEIYVVHGLELPSLCSKEYSYVVESPNPPGVDFIKSQDSLCAQQPVQLSAVVSPASSLYKYEWSPRSFVNNPIASTTLVYPPESMWFYCRVYTATLCVDVIDSVFVEVIPSDIVSVNATTTDSLICRGDTITLQANSQTQIFYDNFNSGISTNWLAVTGGEASTACGSTTGDGLWFNEAGAREAITQDLNVNGGGTISFDLKIADGTFPCDNANFGEDVVLEYSIDNGITWNNIATFYEISYPDFTKIKLSIPGIAATNNTRFRWRQLANSGLNQDNWILDEVLITAVDSIGFTYSWTPADSVFFNNAFTTQASPNNDIKYYIEVESATGCIYKDSLTIGVGEPFDLITTNDTLMCYLNGIEIQALPTAGEGHSIVWTPDSSLSDPMSFMPIATPDVTTNYTATVTSRHGCQAIDTIILTYVRKAELLIDPPGNTICIGDTLNLISRIYNARGCYTDTMLIAIDIDTVTVIDTTILDISTSIFNAEGTDMKRLQYKLNYATDFGEYFAGGPLLDAGLVADELILGIALFVDSTGIDSTFENFTIRMGCEDANNILNGGFGVYEFYQNLSTVYLPKTIDLHKGWNYFIFDTAYFIQGDIGNVYVDMCYSNSDSNSFASIKVDNTTQISGTYSGENACDTSDGNLYDYVPATRVIHSAVREPNIVYNWSPGTEVDDSTNYQVTTSPDATTIFMLTARDTVTGCVFNNTSSIQVDDSVINVTVTPLDTFICEGRIVQLQALGGNFYSWAPTTGLNNPNIPNPVASPMDSTTYTVTISNACWTTTREATIDIKQSPSIEKPDDITICLGDTVQANLNSDDGIILWTPAFGLSNPNIKNPFIFPDQTLTYRILLTDSNTNCYSSTSFTVDVANQTGEILTPDTTICIGDTIQLRATGAEEYNWAPNDLVGSPTSSITDAFPNQTTDFQVVFTFQYCEADTQQVTVDVQDFSFQIIQDTAICLGESVLLYATGNEPLEYSWSPQIDLTEITDDTVLVTPNITTIYVATAQNALGCMNKDSATVTVIDLSTISSLSDTSIVLGTSIRIIGLQDGYVYNWTPDDYLSCNDCPSPIANPEENITYIVTIEDSLGTCIFIDTITISVIDPFLEIPSAFSPNGDGNNDIFIPVQAGVKEVIRFDIYNRWGQLVFSTEQTNSGWDGSFNGKVQPIGIYNYIFKATMFGEGGNEEVERSGTVLLAR